MAVIFPTRLQFLGTVSTTALMPCKDNRYVRVQSCAFDWNKNILATSSSPVVLAHDADPELSGDGLTASEWGFPGIQVPPTWSPRFPTTCSPGGWER